MLKPFEDEGWVVAQMGSKRGIAPCPYLAKMIFPEPGSDGSGASASQRADDKSGKQQPLPQAEAIPASFSPTPTSAAQAGQAGLLMDDAAEKKLPAKCVAAWDFEPESVDELGMKKGDVVVVVVTDHL